MAVLAKAGRVFDRGVGSVRRPPAGNGLAKGATGAPPTPERIRSLLQLIDILDGHESRFAAMIARAAGRPPWLIK